MNDAIIKLTDAKSCIQRGKEMMRLTAFSNNNSFVDLGIFANTQEDFGNTDNYEDTPLGMDMRAVFNESINGERQERLKDMERYLRSRYDDPLSGELSHADIGHILRDLRADQTLTDLEKAYIFTELANNKEGGAWIFGIGGDDGNYEINNIGVRPELIDSAVFNEDATQVHTVVGFDDDYHARLGGVEGDNGRAEMEVAEHEDGILPSFFPTIPRLSDNPGDAAASMATIKAFRAYREGGFDAFADTWIDNILVDDWESITEQEMELPPSGTTTTTVPESSKDHTTSPTITIPDQPSPPNGTTTTS